ncbi:MAG: PAS domain-containing sensor histidine kinase [Ramlibacter sp.]
MVWIAVTVLASVLVCATVVALYLFQGRTLAHTTSVISDLHQARIDLYQGFTHATLGETGGSPWHRERGPVLMEQGIAEFRRVLAQLADTGARQALEAELRQFVALVQQTAAGPGTEAELGAAFHRLDGLAQQAELRARTDLQALGQVQAKAFWTMLSLLSCLLALIGLGAVRSGRREAAAMAALRESETRFRQLAESIREVFWLSDSDKRELFYVSPAYQSIWGRSPAALMRQPQSWLESVHPDDRDRVRGRLATQPEGGYDEEYRVVRPDGSICWIRDRAFPVCDAGGRVYRIAGVAEDITARKQAESRLHESERRLRDIIDLVPHAIYAKDGEGRYLLANRATAARLGCRPEDLLGRRPEEFGLDADDAAEDRRVDAKVLCTGTRYDAPAVRRRFRDATVEFAFSKVPFSFGGSGVDSVLGVSTDITELKQTEARLKETVALLQATFQSTDNGVMVTGRDGTLLLWNERLVELLGSRTALASGQEAVVLAAVAADGRCPIVGGVLKPVVRRPDGSWLESCAQPMVVDGSPAGRVWTFRDVTARERALADAQSREQELEARVHERTRELAQAYAQLQSFSDAVSHDLRAPLSAIAAFGQAALRQYGDQLEPQARHYMERVVAASRQMQDMIHGLLELSRHARAPVHRRALDLGAMAWEAYELQAAAAGRRRVELKIEDNLCGSGDPVLVATLLQNLIGNALKYSRHRDPARIEVGMCREGSTPHFFVRDNGAGFDPHAADRLFKPFSRLHSASEFEGYGIGLATASRIVALHGGRIWAEGAPEQGATFRFTLE